MGEALKQDKTWTTGYPQGTRTRIRKSDGARIDEFKCKLSNSHKCPYRIRSVTLADRDQTDVEQKGEHDHKEDHSMKLSRQAKALIKPMICHRMLPSAIRSNLVDAGLETLPTLEQIQGYRTRNYAELVGAQQVTTVENLVKVAKEYNLFRLVPDAGANGEADFENKVGILLWMVDEKGGTGQLLNEDNEFEDMDVDDEQDWLASLMKTCEEKLIAAPQLVRVWQGESISLSQFE